MKKSLSLLLAVVICLTSLAAFAAGDNIKVYLDGKQLTFDVEPQFINERVMVPARRILEAIGATVEYDEEAETIEAFNEITTVSLAVGVPKISINGVEKNMDVAPVEINGRTLIPARFAADAFGCDVKWEEATQSVFITSTDERNFSYRDFETNFNQLITMIKIGGRWESELNAYSHFVYLPTTKNMQRSGKAFYYPDTNSVSVVLTARSFRDYSFGEDTTMFAITFSEDSATASIQLTNNNYSNLNITFASKPYASSWTLSNDTGIKSYSQSKANTDALFNSNIDATESLLKSEFGISLSELGMNIKL